MVIYLGQPDSRGMSTWRSNPINRISHGSEKKISTKILIDLLSAGLTFLHLFFNDFVCG